MIVATSPASKEVNPSDDNSVAGPLVKLAGEHSSSGTLEDSDDTTSDSDGPDLLRIGGLVTGGVMLAAPMVVALPVLGAIGFGAAGPIAGGIAAGVQSLLGPVAAGGVFATLQSAAMGGYGAAVVGGAVQAAGAGLGLYSVFGRRNEPTPSCTPSCTCDCHRPPPSQPLPLLLPPSSPSPSRSPASPASNPPHSSIAKNPDLPTSSSNALSSQQCSVESCRCVCHTTDSSTVPL